LYLVILAIMVVPIFVVFAVVGGGVALAGGLSLGSLNPDTFGEAMGPIGALAFIVAGGAVVAYSFWLLPLWLFGVPELVVSDASAIEALRRAWQVGSGQRLTVFGYSMMSGLVTIAGMVACCVGVIPALGVAYLLNLGLFLAARNDPALELPPRE
jgi:hypothetical protein